MTNNSNGNGIWRAVGVATISGLLGLNAFLISGMRSELSDINNKLFIHLTNHELHIPRGQIVSRIEFEIQMKQICEAIVDLKKSIEKRSK